MGHLRMVAGESHRGVVRRGVGLSTIARLGKVSPLSPCLGTSPQFFGSGAGRTALRNLLVMLRIGINAPLTLSLFDPEIGEVQNVRRCPGDRSGRDGHRLRFSLDPRLPRHADRD
jgi:hypothetical protein